MMLQEVVTKHQLGRARLFLARNPILNVLPLGDCYWPLLKVSRLYCASEGGDVIGVCSIYRGFSKPSVVLSAAPTETRKALLNAAMKEVTGEFTTLCSSDELKLFKEYGSVLTAEVEYQMIANPPEKPEISRKPPRRVRKNELKELDTFYCEHHSEAWTPLQFEVGPFYCVKVEGKIVSAAGTHLASPQIAHMGSVITDEAFRGRGYATKCTSKVAEALSCNGRRTVSLFVRTENTRAINMYEKLGFKTKREICLVRCNKTPSDLKGKIERKKRSSNVQSFSTV